MDCPRCQGKTRATSTRKTFRWRKCLDCGHKFKTARINEQELTDRNYLARLLAERYGVKLRDSMLDRFLAVKQETILEYFDHGDLICDTYEDATGQKVNDPVAFICNAILTEQPIPYQKVEPPRPRQTEIEPEAADVWGEIIDTNSHVSVLQRSICLGLFDKRMIILAFNDQEKEIIEHRYMDTLTSYTNGYNIKIVS